MKTYKTVAAVILACGALPPAHAGTLVFSVDCSAGETIAAALARGDERKPLVLNISGTCYEAVSIVRDKVTLQGNPRASISPLSSTVRAVDISASDVRLINLDVVGGNLGIAFNGTARAVASNCTVQDTQGDGIRLFSGDARIMSTRVERAGGNGISLQRRSSLALSNDSAVVDSRADGIYVNQDSIVNVTGSSISSNGLHGIELDNGSVAIVSGSQLQDNGADPDAGGAGIALAQSRAAIGSGNTISGNDGDGVLVLAGGSASVDGNVITGNAQNGVMGYLGPTVVMHGNEIRNNGASGVGCRSHCTVQIGAGAQIEGNGSDGIVLMLGSVLIIEETGATSLDNNYWGLWCGDDQSRVDGRAYFTGTVSDGCRDFGY